MHSKNYNIFNSSFISGVGELSWVVLHFHERKIFIEILLSKNSDRKGVFPYFSHWWRSYFFYLLLAINTHFKVQRKLFHISAKNKTYRCYTTQKPDILLLVFV